MISGGKEFSNLVAAYEVLIITSAAVVHGRIMCCIKSSE